MPSQFKKNHIVEFEKASADPWAVMAYFEALLNSRLTSDSERNFATNCNIRLGEGGRHEADSIAELKPMLRPFEEDDVEWLSVTCNASADGRYSVYVYLWMNRPQFKLDIDIEAPDELFALGWLATVKQEAVSALSGRPPAILPVETPVLEGPAPSAATPSPSTPAPRTTAAASASDTSKSPFRTWLGHLSVEVVGGVLVVAIIAGAALLYKLL